MQHTLVNKPRLLCDEGSLVLALRGGKPPHSSFLSLLWEEKGVLDTSERQSAVGVGTPDPIVLDSPLPDDLLGGQRLQQPLDPRPYSSGSTARVNTQSKVKDYFIMITNPGQWGQGAYNEFNHNFNI